MLFGIFRADQRESKDMIGKILTSQFPWAGDLRLFTRLRSAGDPPIGKFVSYSTQHLHVKHKDFVMDEQEARLPPVDPDFLIEERDLGKLAACARGLLAHLRDIRSGQRANGYPITKIRAATVWLWEAYIAAGAAPAPEAAQLIQELLKANPKAGTLPVRPSNTDAYFAAIAFEAAHPPDETGKAPSVASRYAVARHIRQQGGKTFSSQKTAEAQIRGWRRLEHYRSSVNLLRPAPKHEDIDKTAHLPRLGPDFVIEKCDLAKLAVFARGLLTQLRSIQSRRKAISDSGDEDALGAANGMGATGTEVAPSICPADGYPISTIRTAAAWLMDSYVSAVAPPPPVAAELIRELLKPDRDASTLPVRQSSAEDYFAAIAFEAEHRPDKTDKSPSAASIYSVARHMQQRSEKKYRSQKTAEGIVRGWRELEHYRANVALQRSASLRVKS